MATYGGSTSAQQAQAIRDTWQRFRTPTARLFGRVFAFFTAYPPLAQGLYYVLWGLWPLIGLASYQRMTGHEGDLVAIRMVGVLLLVIGGSLCLAAYRRLGSPEVLFIAFGSALGLTAVDVHLIWAGHMIYLLDAVLEMGLVAFWVYGWRQGQVTVGTAAVTAPAPAAQPVATAAPVAQPVART